MATHISIGSILGWGVPSAILVAELVFVGLQMFPISTLNVAGSAGMQPPSAARIEGDVFAYRQAGYFIKNGRAVDAPLEATRLTHSFEMMTSQVSVADYARCVDAKICKAADISKTSPLNVPVTGVSFDDANKYAQWLSASTGQNWRLPSDEEWALAARDRYVDDALCLENETGDNPAERWLAEYRVSAESGGEVRTPLPLGSFGANENGLWDMSGNVWEWTSTCYVRTTFDAKNSEQHKIENCGVRVVQGAHRSYISSFIRDARSGGCSAGSPPDNLGFRLVRELGWWEQFMA